MRRTRQLTVTELDENERKRVARKGKRLGLTPTQVLERERVEARVANEGVISVRLSDEVKAALGRRANGNGLSIAAQAREILAHSVGL